MTSIQCPECHRQIPAAVILCPHCQRPVRMPRLTMIENATRDLKILLLAGGIILILGLLLVVVGYFAFMFKLFVAGVVISILVAVGYACVQIAIWWRYR